MSAGVLSLHALFLGLFLTLIVGLDMARDVVRVPLAKYALLAASIGALSWGFPQALIAYTWWPQFTTDLASPHMFLNLVVLPLLTIFCWFVLFMAGGIVTELCVDDTEGEQPSSNPYPDPYQERVLDDSHDWLEEL